MNVYETVLSRVRIESDRLIKMFGHFKIDDNAKAPSFYSFRINAKKIISLLYCLLESHFSNFLIIFQIHHVTRSAEKSKKTPLGPRLLLYYFSLDMSFLVLCRQKYFLLPWWNELDLTT